MTSIHRWMGMALLVPLGTACGTTEAEEAPGIQTVPVQRGDLMITAEATGSLEPVRTVEVKSKASGEILRLHFDIGDLVAEGALLAEIDPRDVRNGFDQAEADLDVAQARLDISKAQLDRSERLLASGVISVQEHETRNLDYANAQATFVKAKTNHELSQLRLEDVTIRAPMTGTVLQKSVEEGNVIQSASQNVSGGTTLLVMANLNIMQVRTLVDETDMGEIRAGMEATVQVEAYPDRQFIGTVDKIEPQATVQQNVTMFPVIVRLDNSSGILKPGMNAEVAIAIAEAPGVLLVPNNAIVTPQDAGPAAMTLGLDPEALDLRSMFAGRSGRGGRPGGSGGARGGRGERGSEPAAGRQGNGQGGQGGGQGQGGARRSGAGAGNAGFDSIRARVTRGEISQDSARALFQRSRSQGSGGGFGGFGQDRGGPGGDQGVDGIRRESRTAVLFVVGEDGVIELRVVQIGLNDWDFTQVVSGVEEGEQIALIGAAQLRATQEAFLNRFRGNGNPFGGGTRGRR